LNGIGEDGKSIGLLNFCTGPTGMLGFVDESFRVGHEAQDPTGGIAEAGNMVGGTVGIYGEIAEVAVFVHVAEGNMAFRFEPVQDFRMGEADLALTVGHRQI